MNAIYTEFNMHGSAEEKNKMERKKKNQTFTK